MPASEAQIRANQANAKKSTGPKTEEGKAISRANSLKHGLTGAGTVLPEREAIEVRRRYHSFCTELKPSGEVGLFLVLHAATMSVRMERCGEYENASLIERVRRAEADFVPPEGVDPAEEARLRQEAGRRALFDPSEEATRARKYEAAAERGFFRALKELRRHEDAIRPADPAEIEEELGSFLPGEMTDEEFDRISFEELRATARTIAHPPVSGDLPAPRARFDVPITIGKPR